MIKVDKEKFGPWAIITGLRRELARNLRGR